MANDKRSLLILIILISNLISYAEPALSVGLGDDSANDEPSLPEGLLGGDDHTESAGVPEPSGRSLNYTLTGFGELRMGLWDRANPVNPDLPLSELRFRVDLNGFTEGIRYRISTDFVGDESAPHHKIDFRRGEGFIDLREAWISFSPISSIDLRIGRQINTWGTGDLVFLNDLFPKDYQSFLLGRDEEMLKAPSNSLRASLFLSEVNIDLVITPQFNPDRYIRGERLSYYNSAMGSIVGETAIIDPSIPNGATFAARIYRTMGSVEYALYLYNGYWPSPSGLDNSGASTFHDLSSIGASLRRPLGKGIFNAEVSWYRSDDDSSGTNPLINNSQFRTLLGYQLEIAKNLTAMLQWSTETLLNYGAYERSQPAGAKVDDQTRHVLSLRLTKMALNEDLMLSLFAFYSPTDEDVYLRPQFSYKINDRWHIAGGANIFEGNMPTTFFGQFEKNSNYYLAIRFFY